MKKSDTPRSSRFQWQAEPLPPAASIDPTRWAADPAVLWLTDRGRKIAFFWPSEGAVDWFEAGARRRRVPEPRIADHYDAARQLGMRIRMWPYGYPSGLEPGGTSVQATVSGTTATLEMRTRYADGAAARNTLTFRIGRVADRYEADLACELIQPESRTVEVTNLWPGDSALSNPGHKNYSHVVFRGIDGHDYKEPLSWVRYLSGACPSASKALPNGGFLLFAVHGDFNFLAEHAGANVLQSVGTCDQWFDQHIYHASPGMECFDGTDFRSWSRYRLRILTDAEARPRLAAAKALVPTASIENVIPFRMEFVNHFNESIVPDDTGQFGALVAAWAPASGRGLPLPATRMAVDTVVRRRAVPSLRLSGLPGRTLAVSLRSGSYKALRDRSYVIQAYVRWEGVADAAWLELRPLMYRGSDQFPPALTRCLRGRGGWTPLRAVLHNTENFNYVIPVLAIRGPGTLWMNSVYAGLQDKAPPI